MSLSCRTTSPLLVTIMMPSPFLNEELPLGIFDFTVMRYADNKDIFANFYILKSLSAMLCLLVNSKFYGLRLTVCDKVNGDCRTALILYGSDIAYY